MELLREICLTIILVTGAVGCIVFAVAVVHDVIADIRKWYCR